MQIISFIIHVSEGLKKFYSIIFFLCQSCLSSPLLTVIAKYSGTVLFHNQDDYCSTIFLLSRAFGISFWHLRWISVLEHHMLLFDWKKGIYIYIYIIWYKHTHILRFLACFHCYLSPTCTKDIVDLWLKIIAVFSSFFLLPVHLGPLCLHIVHRNWIHNSWSNEIH